MCSELPPDVLDRRDFHKLTAAALGGLAAGAILGCGGAADPAAQVVAPSEVHLCRGLNECKGQGKGGGNACRGQGACATAKEHACGGQNECKGLGGCGDNGRRERVQRARRLPRAADGRRLGHAPREARRPNGPRRSWSSSDPPAAKAHERRSATGSAQRPGHGANRFGLGSTPRPRRRPAERPLRAHPAALAGGRLVRGHLRELPRFAGPAAIRAASRSPSATRS